MPNFRKRYTLEEKLLIIRESLDSSDTVKDVAERYGIHEATISRWRKTYGSDISEDVKGQVKSHLEKRPDMDGQLRRIQELERELAEARLEREILKKAIRIFSKTDGKYLS